MKLVRYHEPDNFWDRSLLNDIFKDPIFDVDSDGCIYFVAGEHADADEVNSKIASCKWAILIVTSDEQSAFEIEKIKHPNIRIWIMYPKQGRHDKYMKLPLGYTPHTRENLALLDKTLDYFFSGQVTHERRQTCCDKLKPIANGKLVSSSGFAQGMAAKEYMGYMNLAKVAPSPSGPVCADSFRVYEALEAGALPIADNISLAGDVDYFDYLLPDAPFPTLDNYKDLEGYVADAVEHYPYANNRSQAWWLRYKHGLKQAFIDDIETLSGLALTKDITIVIPVSPIKSHPSVEILEKCIATLKIHLPNAPIVITFDGVRKEQEDRRADYEEFMRRALFYCNTIWNATPVIFEEHTHQVGMMRGIIDDIKTPTVLYVEGDTGLTPDTPIDFDYCLEKLADGTSNLIRFHFESRIPDEHKHLMLSQDGKLLETVQWSQRPHIASTAYYRRILQDYFSGDAKSFIEDKMHSVLQVAYNQDKRAGWLQHRLHIYAPDDYLKRSVNFDGRENEPKWDETQVF